MVIYTQTTKHPTHHTPSSRPTPAAVPGDPATLSDKSIEIQRVLHEVARRTARDNVPLFVGAVTVDAVDADKLPLLLAPTVRTCGRHRSHVDILRDGHPNATRACLRFERHPLPRRARTPPLTVGAVLRRFAVGTLGRCSRGAGGAYRSQKRRTSRTIRSTNVRRSWAMRAALI